MIVDSVFVNVPFVGERKRVKMALWALLSRERSAVSFSPSDDPRGLELEVAVKSRIGVAGEASSSSKDARGAGDSGDSTGFIRFKAWCAAWGEGELPGKMRITLKEASRRKVKASKFLS